MPPAVRFAKRFVSMSFSVTITPSGRAFDMQRDETVLIYQDKLAVRKRPR